MPIQAIRSLAEGEKADQVGGQDGIALAKASFRLPIGRDEEITKLRDLWFAQHLLPCGSYRIVSLTTRVRNQIRHYDAVQAEAGGVGLGACA